MEQENELSGFPGLETLKKQEPYKVPEGYFNSFSERLPDLLVKPVRNQLRIRKVVLVSCGLTVIIAPAILLFQKPESKPLIEPSYTDLIESGYVFELDEALLSDEYSTMFHGAPRENDMIEDYLIENTDETSLKSQL
jgi:hypothetical protein